MRIVCLIMIAALSGVGCEGKDTSRKDAFIIRFDGGLVTPADFENAFETAFSIYSDQWTTDPFEIKKAKLRFVNQLVEELVITRLAETSGITISETELDRAVAEIKKDYPENTFEQTLLENAVSFESWKKRLKTRLLMEKVTSTMITRNIELTAKEIETAYKTYASEFDAKKNKDSEPADLNRWIVERLRHDKTESAYEKWIQDLKEKYHVEIDRKQLELVVNG